VKFVSPRRIASTLAALLAVTGTAACSGPGSAPGPASTRASALVKPAATDDFTQVIQLKARDSFSFEPDVIRVRPGRVRLVLAATGKKPQNFTSFRLGADSGNVPAGTSTVIELFIPKPGKYPFYNAYYRKQGMKGKIVATG
jgi:plastocyanin